MGNFSTFFTLAMKSKNKKVKRGKYKGQTRELTDRKLREPGPVYRPIQNANKLSAPSASTFTLKG